MSPLEAEIIREIETEGPMRLDRFMALCLTHPLHGYYVTQQPFGAAGDFITAPEVSQVFGELIGIWCVAAWQSLGAPSSFALVELGPGRGHLMSDILRAARVMPAFEKAAQVHLIEASPKLIEVQRKAIGREATWHQRLEEVPAGPMLLVANEFFDALPIRQFEKRDGRWNERVVGLSDGGLTPGLVPSPDFSQAAPEGAIIEWAPLRSAIGVEIGRRLAAAPAAALVIDYGHLKSAPGDTLQAMRRHAYMPVLDSPGLSDLTSHVDFEALGTALRQSGAAVHPAMPQRSFLLAMGLQARFAKLSAQADEKLRASLARAQSRLADEDQMGNLFKVLAASTPGFPPPYPFGGS